MKKILVILLTALLAFSCASCNKPDTEPAPSPAPNDTDPAQPSDTDEPSGEGLWEKKQSADEALARARAEGIVITENAHVTCGKELMEDFYAKTKRGEPASLLIAKYYTLDREHTSEELYEQEKDSYPMLFLTLVEYDGNEYSYKARLSSDDALDSSGSFKLLMHYSGFDPSGRGVYYDQYTLTNNELLTRGRIMQYYISSQLPPFWEDLAHYTIYSDLTPKS
ncbi:MAG: hypothetical protein K6G56_05135 [Clostridiales bacterium]|nr:hypothetical protein [Clostridiales bacterium]